MADRPDAVIIVVPIQSLMPRVQEALARARLSDGNWDEDQLRTIVQQEFDFLAPYTDVRLEKGSVEGGKAEDALLISFSPPPGRDLVAGERRFQKATRRAEEGDVKAAQRDLAKLVREFPEVAKYRRALGQTYLVLGGVDRAEDELLRSLALNPNDPDALTLLGNLYTKRGAPARAIPLYQRSLERHRNVYALTNLGAALSELGQLDAGIQALQEAVTVDSKYPNAWFGLGLALSRKEDLALLPAALRALDRALHEAGERRRNPELWDTSRSLLNSLSQIEAREESAKAKEAIAAAVSRMSEEGELPIRLEEEELKGAKAKIEYGWIHSKPYHRVVVTPRSGVLREHYVLHELEHLQLATLARRAGTNRWFSSTAATRERAIRSFGNEVARLAKSGIPETDLTSLTMSSVEGLLLQLFNFPIDFLIEDRLLEQHATLRELVYNSICDQLTTAIRIAEDRRIAELTPRVIFRANTAMNGAFALWLEEHFPLRSDFVSRFGQFEPWPLAKQLFATWKAAAVRWTAGAEYDWVDDWAHRIGLVDWYAWIDGNPGTTESEPGSSESTVDPR